MPRVITDDDLDELKDHREHAFWISNKRIYLEYFNISSGRYQCHIFNTHNKQWESVSIKHCFNFLQYPMAASKIKNLGNNLYAITSSAGGWRGYIQGNKVDL